MMVLFLSFATAQNEGQYTHFMFNQLSYNPAYAGSQGALSFSLLYNNQWMGLDLQAPLPDLDAGTTPTNYLASFDMPVTFLHGGIGLLFNSESIGYHQNTTINLDYAFRIYWGRGNLAAGIEVNLYNFSFNTENLVGIDGLSGDPGNPTTGTQDPSVNGQQVSEFMFDLATGVYYQVPGEYYLSLSVKNLLGSKSETLAWKNARTLYLMGGYEYAFPYNPSFKLKPNIMAKTADFSTFQAEASLLLDYESAFWGGLGYRLGDAFMFLAGVNWNFSNLNWLRIGVAYDLTTSKLGYLKPGRSFGSLEFFLNGTFRIITPQNPPTVSRTTRFLL
ncbi:MAG: type IX secretion system membrane protein PorP/SprF [Bacteroidales bacterium]|nr:type IX secretion system membrane protein PorP/SprF [Bacteroidales bacterium]